jgi:hypothetical protein
MELLMPIPSRSALFAIASLVLSAIALSTHAQSTKPGLWEVTSKVGGSPEMDKAMAQMQQQMANMPPDQRKQMEAMMGKQGMSLSGASGGGMQIKTCLSKEMAEKSQMPMRTQGDCTSTVSDKTSTGMRMKFVCTNPPSSGDGQFTFSGDSAYTMKMNVSSSHQGKPQTTTIEGSGKWLGSDCGSIKPIELPKK